MTLNFIIHKIVLIICYYLFARYILDREKLHESVTFGSFSIVQYSGLILSILSCHLINYHESRTEIVFNV